ncbi:MAG TPA: ABC transporter permease [Holosporales bacterium]|nr:ABC transporter permease [Holosporales bacterium]
MKQNYLFFLVLFFICKSLGYTQIVNKGTLKILSNTDVYFGIKYTNDGSHTNDGNLYLKGNFINNGTTAAATTSTTHFTRTDSIQEIKGSANKVNFYNLVINNTSSGVSIVNAFELNVVNSVTLTNGDLRLVGEAQLLQSHTGANANTGTGKLLRDQQGISSKFGYNYWSSPVTTSPGIFKLNEGLYDGTDASTNAFSPTLAYISPTGFDGSATTPITISERWLYTYSANTAGYAGWDKIYQNSPINPGEGFTMKGTGAANQNYVFKGLPNDGDYSFPIATGQSVLLGNPYPSALDSQEFINDNPSVNQIEIWIDGGSDTHYLADYEGGYGVLNNTGGVAASVPSGIFGLGTSSGVTPKRYLAVAQGFFVEAISNNPIVFNNSQRIFKTETSGDSNFYKSSKIKNTDQEKNNENEQFIRIGYEDPEKYHRQLLLGFLPNSPANLNCNRGYDALMSSPREDELFFIIENDLTKKYVIQGVNAFDENDEFPLGLIMTEAGVHTIMLDTLENFTGKVYIKDMMANMFCDLTKDSFTPNLSPGTYLDRFRLVFKDKTAVVINEDINPNLGISAEKTNVYYHENGSFIVRTKNDLQVNNISIYNMLGQQIKKVSDNMLGKNVFSIPFQHPKSVYIVVVDSELGKETFRIINK